MVWVKLTDTWAEDPRLEDAGADAAILAVAGLCYCSRNLTDGRIPRATARRLFAVTDPDAAIAALVRVGIWAETHDGSLEVVDYELDQPTKDQILDRRAKTAERLANYRARRAGNAVTNGVGNGVSTRAPSRPVPKTGKGKGSEQVRSLAPSGASSPARIEPRDFSFTMPKRPTKGGNR